MGGAGSKPGISNSKDSPEPNKKTTPKSKTKPVPYIIESVPLQPSDKSPDRRRRKLSKRARARESSPDDAELRAAETTPDSHQHAGGQHAQSKATREAGKIESLVRGRVKSIRDWKMISSRGSRSAAPVLTSSPANVKHSNQFNFHHTSYLAQTKPEKHSGVDFSSPRHLNVSPPRQPFPDYAITKHRNPIYTSSGYIKGTTRRLSPDNIPPPNRYDLKKDLNYSYDKTKNVSRHNSPSYLYSLELKQRSSVHCAESSYVTRTSRSPSPGYKVKHGDGNMLVVKPSRDNVNRGDMKPRSDWTPPAGDCTSKKYLDAYSTPIEKEEVPIFLPRVPQDVIVQRVEVKPDLDYTVMKPKTIRVNGVEYVRRKSNHPLMKQLLTVDKNQESVTTTLIENPESDRTGKSKKVSKVEKQDVNIAKQDRSKSQDAKDLEMNLDKKVEKSADKGQVIKPKSQGRESETKEMNKSVIDGKGDDKNVSGKLGVETKRVGMQEKTAPEKGKRDEVEIKYTVLHEIERKETERGNKKKDGSVQNVLEKNERSKRESNSKVVGERKDTSKQENSVNVIESRDVSKRENASNDRDKKDNSRHEKITNDVEKPDGKGRQCESKCFDEKVLSKADRELLRQCRIKHMPVAVSSTGRLFLPSMRFMATPMATMADNTTKLTACASEKSYCRPSRPTRLSPNRQRYSSTLPGVSGCTQRQTSHLGKQQLAYIYTAEQDKVSSKKASYESKEHLNMLYLLDANSSKTNSTNSPTLSRSNSPRKTNGGRISPKVGSSRHELYDNFTGTSKEQKAMKEQRLAEKEGDEKSNRECMGMSHHKQTFKEANEEDIKTYKQSKGQLVVRESSSKGSVRSSTKAMNHKPSQRSMDAWYSKSVRSKNKIFETIIERSSSLISASRPDDYHCESCLSSPHSDSSDTPFSKAIRHKYRAISSKRSSRPKSIPVVPHVFTPWDSCMMFKSGLSRPSSPPQKFSSSHLQPRQSASSKSHRKSSTKLDINRASKDGTTSDESNQARKEVSTDVKPAHTFQVMRNLHHEGKPLKKVADCSCELAVCRCVEVKQNPKPASARCGFSKLNRETVIDFEKKFKNTHVYRAVAGDGCSLPGANISCQEKHGRSLAQNKGRTDLATVLGDNENKGAVAVPVEIKRQRRCSSCGKSGEVYYKGTGRDEAARCCKECGGPLDSDLGEEVTRPATRGRCSNCGEQHDMRGCTLKCCAHCGGQCGGRGEDVSANGSSSGLSTKSGQVPPYKKVLKMFETKSKINTENASRQWRAPSEQRPKVVAKPATRLTHHKTSHEEPERQSPRRLPDHLHPRDVIIQRRRHRMPSEESDAERPDPHFNRSEQELFRNARLQWMARDQQKRSLHLQGIRSTNHANMGSNTATNLRYEQQQQEMRHNMSPRSRGILRRGRIRD